MFRRFCLTLNNYNKDSLEMCINTGHTYIIVGKETGEKNGTPHYQMYVEYEHAKTYSAVIKAFKKKCHIEAARADEKKNREYCSKQEVIFEEGTPKQQGKRNDLKRIVSEIESGSNVRDMIKKETFSNLQGMRMAENLFKYIEPQRKTAPKVIWRYGETGLGKTKWVYENYTEVFTPISFKWWEGYDGHKVVLIDDIREDWCTFAEFLRLTDKYPMRVECKGGSRQLLATTIIITCPLHPSNVWTTNEDNTQLLRRISDIMLVTKQGE